MIKFITSIVEWTLKGVPYLCVMETVLLVYLYNKRNKIFEKQKVQQKNEENPRNNYIELEKKHSLLKLHMIYVLCIACFLCVVFLTYKLSDADKFGEMLSFAGTISSIILSIVAIFMSINGEGKSDEIRREMSNSSNKLAETADGLENHLDNVLIQIKELEKRLNKKLDGVGSEVENIHKDTTELKKAQVALEKGNSETDQMKSFKFFEKWQ